MARQPQADDWTASVAAIEQAALDTTIAHLEHYPDSAAQEQLWEDHPLLTQGEAEQAGQLAADLVAAMAQKLRESPGGAV